MIQDISTAPPRGKVVAIEVSAAFDFGTNQPSVFSVYYRLEVSPLMPDSQWMLDTDDRREALALGLLFAHAHGVPLDNRLKEED